jgi:prophage antirepressor-like protein
MSNSNAPVLKPFAHGSAEVRTLTINGQPWFVAKDVCNAIGIVDHKDATRRLDEDESMGCVIPSSSRGNQTMTCISESGLYHLLLTSRRPAAKPFRRWVTDVVLPALRKEGQYTMPGAQVPGAAGTAHSKQSKQGTLFPDMPSLEDLRLRNLLVDVALQCRPGSKVAQLVRLVKNRIQP